MGAKEFGEYFRRETKDKGVSASTVGGKIGAWPPGTDNYLNDTGVRRIYEGGRKLTPEFVQHLIDTFDLNEDEAWAAVIAGALPDEASITAEHLRLLRAIEEPEDDEQAVRAVKRHRSAKRGPTPIESGVDHKSPLSGPYAVSAAYRVARTRPSLMAA